MTDSLADRLLALTTPAGLAIVALLVWLATTELSRQPARSTRRDAILFFVATVAAIVLLQWPFVISRNVFNPDESQAIAQAMRYLHHPIPWRDVDGHTTGPLNSWILSIPLLVGADPSTAMARVIRIIVQISSLLLLYLGIHRASRGTRGRSLTLPLACFFALAFEPDFVHYSSELVSMLLLSGATLAMVPGLARDKTTSTRSFATGLLLGAVPFAKLQAAPLAVVLWIVHGGTILGGRSKCEGRWESRVAVFFAGTLLVPFVILGLVATGGGWNDFTISYLQHNLAYMRHDEAGWGEQLGQLMKSPSFVTFCLLFLVVSLPLLSRVLSRFRKPDKSAAFLVMAGAAWLAASLYVVLAPGWAVEHYLQVLAVGATIALVFFASAVDGDDSDTTPSPSSRATHFALFAVAAVVLAPLAISQRDAAASALPGGPRVAARIAKPMAAIVREGEEIGVWGWLPSLYVETRTPPATRDAHCHFVIEPGTYHDYYLDRYLEDLSASRPPVFVDIAVPGALLWQTWPDESRHESFPKIAAFVEANYVLRETVPSDDPARPFRIYVRRDRASAIRPAFDPAEPLD